MANKFAPFGFQQAKGTGSAPTYEQVTGVIDSGNGTPIYFCDPVDENAGYIIQGNPSAFPMAGVFVGCKYLSVSQKKTVWSNYWPGSDSANPVEAYFINDPNAQFLVQTGNSASPGTVPVTQAMVGSMINFAVGSGNAASGVSGAYADTSTIIASGTTGSAELPFRIVGLATNVPAVATGAGAVPYDPAAANNYIIVAFNNVQTKFLGTV
jgi:hypothetical protein